MKNLNVTTVRIIKTIIYAPFTIVGWFIQWILEKRFNSTTDSLAKIKISDTMEIIKDISPFIFIGFFLIGFIIWIYWVLKDKIEHKNQYFNELESMVIQDKIDIKYLQLQMQHGKDLDLLTIAENFSDEGMKMIGLTPNQINKANKYFNKKYGNEPDRDKQQVPDRT